jgi:hypothetical protein
MSLHTTPERSAPAMDAHNAAISDANRRSRVPSGGSMTHATLSTHTAW